MCHLIRMKKLLFFFLFVAIGTVVLGQLMNNIARVPPAILEVGDERTERGAWKKSA